MKDNFSKLHCLVIFLILILTTNALANVINTYVDRNTITEGETFNLTIEVNDSDADPDFSPLEKDFDVINRSQSSQISITNGRMSKSLKWSITLATKKTGTLLVPALDFGIGHSTPININVQKASNQASRSGQKLRDLFIETSVQPSNPYVQSQITFNIQFYQAVQVQDASLSVPKIDDAVIERLGEDATYDKIVQGRRYRVTERKFAIFPQISGELTIPATIFNGQVISASRRQSPYDQFFRGGADPFNSMFQSTRPVRLRSTETRIKVRPKPQQARGEWWLPVSAFNLTEVWSPDPPEFRVGEPVTRTLFMEARGVTAAQLPDLSKATIADIKAYFDQPVNENITAGQSLVAKKEQKVALVPTKAGLYTLPEIVIHWWDTVSDKPRVSKLPAKKIKVLPTIGQAAQTQNYAPLTQPQINNQATMVPLSSQQQRDNASDMGMQPIGTGNNTGINLWLWTTLLMVVLLTAISFAWWRLNQKYSMLINARNEVNERRAKTIREAKRRLRTACEGNNADSAKQALFEWVKLMWPDKAITSLPSLAEQIDRYNAKKELFTLDRMLYTKEKQDWDGRKFWQEISKAIAMQVESVKKRGKENVLPQLYST